ncbi:MAG TPA: 3-hydroxyacyl-CoA dehydrogenase NAD-binding domain-containing protein [Woeseiaceae bacterium]|nr:3-hydroxyacyl-CoA dehydrogenase NAD-binding domain-containing protein [Woeseiaceae bacterium]
MTTTHWGTERDHDGIAWLRIDKADSRVNVLSRPVLEELASVLEGFERETPRGLVVYSGKSGGFITGADINEFTRITNPDEGYELIRLGQQVLDRLEALRCPTVAAINGHALGGGLELALACDYRIVQQGDQPVLGLPEVQLGIHPGFGGTVRSVRLCGVRAAMELMLTGQPVAPGKALRIGLVDRVVSPDDWRQAARELIDRKPPRRRAPLPDRLLNLAPVRPLLARVLEKQVAKRARREHYPAPYAIVELWRRHGASEQTGYEAEARSIASLLCTPTSRNLVRVFFLQNRLKSQGGKPEHPVRRVHVVGAGVMGGDIAAWCALRGMQVTLQDRGEEYVRPAIERAAKLFERRIRDEAARREAAARLVADVAGGGVAEADLVIEAIFENLEAKRNLYAQVEPALRPEAVLATNTSSLRLEDLRAGLTRPQRFVGLHFFNPVAKLPLVEVIRCEDTERAAVDAAIAFVRDIGKFPLECASAPGFVVNRVLAPYLAEAMRLVEAGVAPRVIDRAAEEFGMPAGPIELLDTVGLDVALDVSEVLGAAFGRPVPSVLREKVAARQLGRKSGQGFYRWQDGKRVPDASAPGAAAAPPDLVDRLILPMLNESVACLSEGVVADADLLDAGVIFGTGFAPFRGGPLEYARARGPRAVEARLAELEREHGAAFRPHPGWREVFREEK